MSNKTIINETITVTAIGAFLSAYFERNTGFLTTDHDRTFSMPDGKQVTATTTKVVGFLEL